MGFPASGSLITSSPIDWNHEILFSPSSTITFDAARDQSPGAALCSTASVTGAVAFSSSGACVVYNYWSAFFAHVGDTVAPDGSPLPGRGVLIGPGYGFYVQIQFLAEVTAVTMNVASLNNPDLNEFAGGVRVELYDVQGSTWTAVPEAFLTTGPDPSFVGIASGAPIGGVRISSVAPQTKPAVDNVAIGSWRQVPTGPEGPPAGDPVPEDVFVPEPAGLGLAAGAVLLICLKGRKIRNL
jgi:hypothetical protein